MSDINSYILTAVLTLATGIFIGGMTSIWVETKKAGIACSQSLPEEIKLEAEIIFD